MSWILTILLASAIQNSDFQIIQPDFTVNRDIPVAAEIDETEVFEQTYPLNPDGRISLGNLNGSVVIKAWDRPEVKLVAKKVSNSREQLSDIEIKISSSQERLDIEVDYKRKKGKWVHGDKLYVNFDLMVPATAVLDEIESVNGSVTVSGMTKMTKVSAVNGSVNATGLRGGVNLSTVNGSVIATFNEVTSGSDIALDTVNGSVQLRIPSNSDAVVKADSVNGSITNEFGLPVKKGTYVGRDLYGRIGSGSSKIKLSSVNGSLKILRLDDGLPISTVENLLPAKGSDDFDDSFVGDIEEAVEAARSSVSVAGVAAKAASEAITKANVEAATEAVIAADSSRIAAEVLESVMAATEVTAVERDRVRAEIARVRSTVFGNRPAPYIVEDSGTVAVEGISSLEINAKGCDVVVKGWSRPEIKYSVTRIAQGRTSPVKNVSFDKSKSGYILDVSLNDASSPTDSLEQVRVELFVPQESNLKIKTDREIRINGVKGELDLQGYKGGINVRDSAGILKVSSSSGMVRVIGFEGALESTTKYADVYLEGGFDRINAKAGNGKVYLALPESAGATVTSNKSSAGANSQSGVEVEGLKFKKPDDATWQFGDGSAVYDFRFDSGSLFVRALDPMISS